MGLPLTSRLGMPSPQHQADSKWAYHFIDLIPHHGGVPTAGEGLPSGVPYTHAEDLLAKPLPPSYSPTLSFGGPHNNMTRCPRALG